MVGTTYRNRSRGIGTSLGRPAGRVFPTLLLLALSAACGCGHSSDSETTATRGDRGRNSAPGQGASPSASREAIDGRAILQEMIDAYEAADHYSDDAQVRLEFVEAGRPRQDVADIAVRFSRPNRLRLRVYHAEVACDGQRFRALIRDEVTDDLDHQYVQRQAPKRLTREELDADPILNAFLNAGLAGYPLQLQLLFDRTRMLELLSDDVVVNRLPDASIDQTVCRRVSVEFDGRKLEFWIDPVDNLLRRLVYPTRGLFPDGESENTRLVAEFRDASFQPIIDDFQLSPPAESKTVRFFIQPPAELPSPLFGKDPGPFAFQLLENAPSDARNRTSAQLRGKVAVLAWFRDHDACRHTLQNLETVRQRFQDDAEVEFLAVCGDPPVVTSDQALTRIGREWSLTMPICRDLEAHGQHAFQIDELPTLVILDRRGTVQIFEERFNPGLAEQLPAVIDRLLAGEDVAREILEQVAAEKRRYAEDLKEGAPVMNTRPQLATATAAKTFRLTPKWRAGRLESPGNVLVVPDRRSQPRILVFDGYHTVLELNQAGDVVRRFSLPTGRGRAFTFLRTGIDGDGRRFFAAAAVYGPQVVVYDEQFEFVMAYPPEDKFEAGINDVILDDLDRDGRLELIVAFGPTRRVESLSLDGQIRWSHVNQTGEVLGLTPTRSDTAPQLLVTQGDADVAGFDANGRPTGQLAASRALFRLFVPPPDSDRNGYCALSAAEDGTLIVCGLDQQLRPTWQHPMPRGGYGNQLQFVTAGNLLATPGTDWVVAAPDGTVLVIDDSGQLADSFALGTYPTGIAVATWDGDRHLILSHEDSVTAFVVDGSDSRRTARAPAR